MVIKPYVFIACCITVVIFIVGFGALIFFKPKYLAAKEKIALFTITLSVCLISTIISWSTLAEIESITLIKSITALANARISGNTSRVDLEDINNLYYTLDELINIKDNANSNLYIEKCNDKVIQEVQEKYERKATDAIPKRADKQTDKLRSDLEVRINAYPTDTPEKEVDKMINMYSEIQSSLNEIIN